MAILDEYILRAARLLRNDSSENADDLCREIIDVFKLDYTNPEFFRCINAASSFHYSSSDLRTIVQMLRLERENQDEERYGSKCCHAITEHIRRLEQALEEGLKGEQLKVVYDSIDYVYANARGYDSYTDGLASYSYGSSNRNDFNDEQTQLRIDKLKHFRDEELRKLKIAEAQGASVSLVQKTTASATSNVQVTLEATFEQIDKLPETTLSDDEKTLLKGMMGDLNTKDKSKRGSKLDKLLSWLAGKGTDVFIAAMPYIVQLIKSQLS